MCWFPVNSCFSVLRSNLEKEILTVLLDILGKMDACILFVQVYVAFIDVVFAYNSDCTCIVNVT